MGQVFALLSCVVYIIAVTPNPASATWTVDKEAAEYGERRYELLDGDGNLLGSVVKTDDYTYYPWTGYVFLDGKKVKDSHGTMRGAKDWVATYLHRLEELRSRKAAQ